MQLCHTFQKLFDYSSLREWTQADKVQDSKLAC